jgi:hypothetical protein
MWITVKDTQLGEIILQRKLTRAEQREASDRQPFRIASQATYPVVLDAIEAYDSPGLADVVVAYYFLKKDIGTARCWSRHGFYFKR